MPLWFGTGMSLSNSVGISDEPSVQDLDRCVDGALIWPRYKLVELGCDVGRAVSAGLGQSS